MVAMEVEGDGGFSGFRARPMEKPPEITTRKSTFKEMVLGGEKAKEKKKYVIC